VFRDYIMPSGTIPVTGALIPHTENGDIRNHDHLSWLTGNTQSDIDARDRFLKTIVKPATLMSEDNFSSSTDFIDVIRNENTPSEWVRLRDILQQFAMAFPRINTFWPSPLFVIIDQILVIEGVHFVNSPLTELHFGTKSAIIVSITSKKIVCIVPENNMGIFDLYLSTPDGDHKLKNAVEYA
jgi:IPT/TIG domain